ncbi:MAG: hypothetical protein D6729_18525 [Deltaproteobacteria bacterium]|nr:MAG: hypothetical protein D6729_18525 [Deltaproteobacteria bacterium]
MPTARKRAGIRVLVSSIAAIVTACAFAGCRPDSGAACLHEARPLAEQVVEAASADQSCREDSECALVEVDLPCWDGCAVPTARANLEAVREALGAAGAACPPCSVQASCAERQAYCDQAQGRCDSCRSLAAVGDGRDPTDRCWAPPQHYCSGVDPAAPPVVACNPAGSLCCTFASGCVPCDLTRCDEAPAAPGCDRPPDDDGRCPSSPAGTVCVDPERYATPPREGGT